MDNDIIMRLLRHAMLCDDFPEIRKHVRNRMLDSPHT